MISYGRGYYINGATTTQCLLYMPHGHTIKGILNGQFIHGNLTIGLVTFSIIWMILLSAYLYLLMFENSWYSHPQFLKRV